MRYCPTYSSSVLAGSVIAAGSFCVDSCAYNADADTNPAKIIVNKQRIFIKLNLKMESASGPAQHRKNFRSQYIDELILHVLVLIRNIQTDNSFILKNLAEMRTQILPLWGLHHKHPIRPLQQIPTHRAL